MTDATDLPGLTICLPTMREAGNLPWLFDLLREELTPFVSDLEILVLDKPTGDGTEEICKERGVRYIGDPSMGFADALRCGFKEAENELIVTMDADGSHHPMYIRWMLEAIKDADLIICSRYVPRGGQEASQFRYITSRILNIWVGTVCSLPIKDLSGGFKMYRKSIFKEFELQSKGFEMQCEITIKACGHGFRVKEIPFCYHPRMEGRSKAAFVRYGLAFLFGSLRLRRFRNSIEFCDYDERAYLSRIPLQSMWQRKRFECMKALQKPEGRTLDVGCGSGRVVIAWPSVIGVDLNIKALRYISADDRRVVQASAAKLPFADASFDTVFCCEVVEHLPAEAPVLDELERILRPGGKLLITTPDYGTPVWPMIERLYKIVVPTAYGHTHIMKYTRNTLIEAMEKRGLKVVAEDRMYMSVVLVLFEKPGTIE